jgi:hypothetical protein
VKVVELLVQVLYQKLLSKLFARLDGFSGPATGNQVDTILFG